MPVETVDSTSADLLSEAARVSGEVDALFESMLSSRGDGRDQVDPEERGDEGPGADARARDAGLGGSDLTAG